MKSEKHERLGEQQHQSFQEMLEEERKARHLRSVLEQGSRSLESDAGELTGAK
jgi:hypothetical protein